MNNSILIVGSGGHAVSCINLLEEIGSFKIQGLIGLREEVGKRIFGYEVIGTDTEIKELYSLAKNIAIGVGQIRDSYLRSKLFDNYLLNGFNIPSLISPFAKLAKDVEVANGVQIFGGSIINKGVKIGKNSIINTGAVLEHNVIIEENCHVSTRVVVNGNVRVSARSFIGSNSVLRQNIVIGENSFVAMGQALTVSLSENSVYGVNK